VMIDLFVGDDRSLSVEQYVLLDHLVKSCLIQ
jgi:hypothetical protein